MPTSTPRPLRADAARNSEKILRAAREVYAEVGPDASLDAVARRAGVGIATLFRRFPDKSALLRAVLDRQFAEQVNPALDRARQDPDPLRGVALMLETALASAIAHHHVLVAARNTGVLTSGAGDRFFDALDPVVRRGQQAGAIRQDLVPEDLRRIMTMLISVAWTMEPGETGWRRYVALILDSLSPANAGTLPEPAPPIRRPDL
ncbi:TetR/AcrR family transcriptional regulator [Streptomyces sp. XM4193]|uniref:TetR/AcrR family transcriptional regulator n=1 Tax=Streptomyces sp. XM4193 TaxID=2929782 RepID=UPI001FF9C43B|nr:TetR/AcrR family transcriptional regulator [Streptomyces sp. XM4193]MCK1797568.1 TetR/AcrR family transcriptional regulator [Streptomyces sp. XM4193]